MDYDTFSKEDISFHVIDEQLTFARRQIAVYTTKVLELSMRRNAAAPISRLSTDILQIIFTLLAHDPIRKIDKWDWIVVAQVCQQWRTVATSTSGFWSNIICQSSSRKRIETSLALSRNMDLSVTFEQADPNVDIKKYLDMLSLVFGKMDRITEIYFDVAERHWDMISKCFTLPAPRLKIIDIKLRHYKTIPSFATGPMFNNVCVLGSGLKRLQLKGILTRTIDNLSILENLAHLILESVQFSNSALPDLLEKCPNLESLVLAKFGIIDPTWPSSKIELPFLRHLRTDEAFVEEIFELHQHLHVPDDCNWDIHCHSNFPFTETITDNNFGFLIQRPLECKTVHIAVLFNVVFIETTSCGMLGADSRDRSSGEIRTTFQLDWIPTGKYSEPIQPICSWIVSLIETSYWKSASMVQFRFDGTTKDIITKTIWINLLKHLVNTVSLGVGFVGESTRTEVEFARALRRYRKDGPHGSSQFEISPLLKDLSLRFAHFDIDFSLELDHSLGCRLLRGSKIDNFRIYDATGYMLDEKRISQFVGKLHWDETDLDDDDEDDVEEDDDEEEVEDYDSDEESQLEDYFSDTTEDLDYDKLDVTETDVEHNEESD